MEMDDFKKAWANMDERLKENQLLNEKLVSEMMQTKTKKSLSRLINYEIFATCIYLIVIPILAWGYSQYGGRNALWDIIVVASAVLCAISFIWELFKVYPLSKVNLSNKIAENIQFVNRYKIMIRLEKAANWIVAPLVFIPIIIYLKQMNVPAYFWIFVACFSVLVILFTIWIYSKFYKGNIASIQQSLDEMRELKEG